MNDLKRYVLTKDNRIIDFKGWTKTRNGVNMPFNHIDRIVHIIGVGSADATYEDYLYTIKAQSDNVFDLIEVGDLVKTGSGKIFDVQKPYTDEGLAIISFNIIFLNKINIIAFYKPNSRGDYIKVWEKEVLCDET